MTFKINVFALSLLPGLQKTNMTCVFKVLSPVLFCIFCLFVFVCFFLQTADTKELTQDKLKAHCKKRVGWGGQE